MVQAQRVFPSKVFLVSRLGLKNGGNAFSIFIPVKRGQDEGETSGWAGAAWQTNKQNGKYKYETAKQIKTKTKTGYTWWDFISHRNNSLKLEKVYESYYYILRNNLFCEKALKSRVFKGKR